MAAHPQKANRENLPSCPSPLSFSPELVQEIVILFVLLFEPPLQQRLHLFLLGGQLRPRCRPWFAGPRFLLPLLGLDRLHNPVQSLVEPLPSQGRAADACPGPLEAVQAKLLGNLR